MLITLIALFLILFITLYLMPQGLLSNTLHFIAAVFASILAFALIEPLTPHLASFRPEYSAGVIYLLTFMLSFGLIRTLADVYVPGNIPLPKPIDWTGGAILGLFATMTIIGSLIVGAELLPMTEMVLGNNRMRDESAANPRSFPARFVTSGFYAANGRSLGGPYMACIHPDLSEELSGYRHTVRAIPKRNC